MEHGDRRNSRLQTEGWEGRPLIENMHHVAGTVLAVVVRAYGGLQTRR